MLEGSEDFTRLTKTFRATGYSPRAAVVAHPHQRHGCYYDGVDPSGEHGFGRHSKSYPSREMDGVSDGEPSFHRHQGQREN